MLKVENISGGYGKTEVVNDLSFSLDQGQVLGVLGPNGCGKSTLLKLLLGFIPKKTGKIWLEDQDFDKLSRKTIAQTMSYIPQRDYMPFPYTALEMVTMGRTNHINKWGIPSKQDIEIAREALEKLKVGHLAQKTYTQISGGERQLVLIARAFCQDTKILIMDEPTASLDFSKQQLIMDAISTAVETGKSVILTTHSPSQPFTIASKVLLMSEGYRVGFGTPLEVLTPESLEAVYGIPMDIITIEDRNKACRKICLPVH